MFIKSLNYHLLIVALLLGSCSTYGEGYKEDTIAFNTYLEEHKFENALKADSVDFVLVSSSACHGCVQISFNRLLTKRNVVLIASSRTLLQNSDLTAGNKNYLEDNTDGLDRLKYHNRNIGIIRMYNKQIYDIVYLEPSTIDSIVNKLYGAP